MSKKVRDIDITMLSEVSVMWRHFKIALIEAATVVVKREVLHGGMKT